jgi:uncharacterized protein
MRIAVTGASGFLGRPLISQLAGAGHEILALGRDPAGLSAWLPPKATARRFDASERPPGELLAGCDAVVNLAGELIGQRWTPEVKRRIRDSRVAGTRAIASAAAAAGSVRALVSASSVAYYGPRGDEPLDESSPPGGDFLGGVCTAWEEALAPARSAGIRVVVLRIGLVLHPDGVALRRMVPLFRAGLGGPLGSGQQVMSWIHRDDAVSLIRHALATEELSGPVNATAPAPVTNREFAHALARALRRPALLPTPAFALRLALGEMSQAVLTGQRALPVRALDSGFRFAYPTLDSALRAFFG